MGAGLRRGSRTRQSALSLSLLHVHAPACRVTLPGQRRRPGPVRDELVTPPPAGPVGSEQSPVSLGSLQAPPPPPP